MSWLFDPRNRAPRLLTALAAAALLTGCPMPGASSPVPDAGKQQVEVVYAFVPRASLAAAIVDQAAALEAEKKFFSASLGIEHIPGLIQDYSIVVFVRNRSPWMPLYGRLRLWNPGHTVQHVDVDISEISEKTDSIYVFDGGDTLFGYKPNDAGKRSEWLWLKARN